ncbi:hypothetical protein EAF04_000641 [Stromatinia cepivora]|nr:hypothetical protein EAF04_000641 [Stromatinia cepivora]
MSASISDVVSTTSASSDDGPSTETTIVSPSGDNHTHTVIFIHGREDFGSDLAQFFFDSKSSDGCSLAEIFPTIRWIFPTAKIRYSAKRDFEFGNFSLRDFVSISRWFDVWDIKEPEYKEELMIPGLQESMEQISEIIEEEAKIISMDKIILGGISQGCAAAILTLLTYGLNMGGFIGLSSWLPFRKNIESLDTIFQVSKIDSNADNLDKSLSPLSIQRKTPILFTHSKNDETVPFAHGEALRETIKRQEYDVVWKEYDDGTHWINPDHGVDDISAFIHTCLDI